MFYTVKIKLEFVITMITATLILLTMLFFHNSQSLSVASVKANNCLIVDPGHGGIDGGAISFAGDKESDINLEIALKLNSIAELYGEECSLTRVDDKARTDALSYSEREDLEHRVKIINSKPNAVLISIHQNCFPTSQPSGAQVLYANNDSSKKLGEICHENIINYLQPYNRRVAEPAPQKLFITTNAKCPAILVECGFMSNQNDVQNLKDQDYQLKLSAVLFASYIQYRYL